MQFTVVIITTRIACSLMLENHMKYIISSRTASVHFCNKEVVLSKVPRQAQNRLLATLPWIFFLQSTSMSRHAMYLLQMVGMYQSTVSVNLKRVLLLKTLIFCTWCIMQKPQKHLYCITVAASLQKRCRRLGHHHCL